MKAMIESDDFMGVIFVKLAPFASQFDGTLIGFSAAVSKEDFVKAAIGGQ